MTIYRRNTLLDTVRGAALCGIVFINAAYYSSVKPLGDVAGSVESLFSHAWSIVFGGKFFTLFSFLFGAGLQIFLTRSQQRNERYFLRYMRRASALYVLGALHSLVWPSDIIVGYVTISFLIMWLFLVPLHYLQGVLAALLVASVCAVFLPVGSGVLAFLTGIAYKLLPFAAGMYVARINGFEWLAKQISGLAKYQLIAGVSVVFFVMGYGVLVVLGATSARMDAYIRFTGYPMAACYFFILAWVHGNCRFYWLSASLAVLGRMSLTHYLTQDTLGRWLIDTTPLAPLRSYCIPIVALVILGGQLGLGSLWLRYFRAGPFEWLVSRVTYGVVKG